MKKILILAALALVLTVTTVACTDNNKKDPADTTDTTVTEKPTDEPTETPTTPDETPTEDGSEDTTETPTGDNSEDTTETPTGDNSEDTTETPTEDGTADTAEPPTVDGSEDSSEDSSETDSDSATEPSNPNEVYDIQSHAAATEFSAAGYTDKVLQLMNYGTAHDLGTLDLSKYSAIIITYGSDSGAMLGDAGSELCLTKNGPVEDADSNAIEGAEIIGKATLSNPTAGWKAGDRTVTIELDTDYNGDVYLAFNMMDNNGIAVSAIELVPVDPA